ncbi:MAG: ribonuclease HII [Candidatus Coprovivens sp.]
MKKKEENIDLLKYEKELYNQGITLIGGVDEVGRGPLVGPVVAACVILPVNYSLPGLTDSKKISEKKRELFYDIIMKEAISVGIGIVGPEKIDEINILEASRLAMKLAIENMDVKPEFVLSDAMKLNNIDIPYKDIIHGDALSLSIAAGSVIAKVTRDRMMYELDKKYPEYGFASHKGYPTKAHLENIAKYGVLENYRFTYKPVSDLINMMKVVIRK